MLVPCYTTICLGLPVTSADVTKIKDKVPLSGTGEVNGDVIEGGSFM